MRNMEENEMEYIWIVLGFQMGKYRWEELNSQGGGGGGGDKEGIIT